MDTIEHNFNLNYIKQTGQRVNIRSIIKCLNLTIQDSEFQEWSKTNLSFIQPLEIQYDKDLGIYYLLNYKSKARSKSIKIQESNEIKETLQRDETQTVSDRSLGFETGHETTHRIARENRSLIMLVQSQALEFQHQTLDSQQQQNKMITLLLDKISDFDKTNKLLLSEKIKLNRELSETKHEIRQLRDLIINSDSRMVHLNDRLASVKRTVKESSIIPVPVQSQAKSLPLQSQALQSQAVQSQAKSQAVQPKQSKSFFEHIF
jgi:transcriptional regulator with GAF, ATPase, and Fis domain